MPSKYDAYWQSRIGDILPLFDEARSGQSRALERIGPGGPG